MKAQTVILAAGDFPHAGGAARALLSDARRVVACDSAANAYHSRYHRWPDVIIGDLDSVRLPKGKASPCTVVSAEEQETNDLEKAIAYCRAQGWRDLVIVGATGKREDHTIGNVFRALAAQVPIVTDYGVFRPFAGAITLKVAKGAALSVFAESAGARMTSRGLAWPLDGVVFSAPHVATLNRATGTRVKITCDGKACVFVSC